MVATAAEPRTFREFWWKVRIGGRESPTLRTLVRNVRRKERKGPAQA
jgi:hypothetical protein